MNKTKILIKLDQLEQYLAKYPEIVPASEEIYVKSFEKQLAVERLLQITIEIMIDISMMLIKHKNLGLPADEDDVFNKLQPYMKEIELYKEMKRFRNLLVHRYGDVNDKLVYYNATNHIDDFYIFITEVKEILSKT